MAAGQIASYPFLLAFFIQTHVLCLSFFLPLSFLSSPRFPPHCSSSKSSTSFSLAHSTISSANVICQSASFLMFSVSESILGGGQRPLQRVRLFLQHPSLQFRIHGRPTCPSLFSKVSPSLFQFQIQHVFLPCAQHHIVGERHLPKCFFSDVFRQ